MIKINYAYLEISVLKMIRKLVLTTILIFK